MCGGVKSPGLLCKVLGQGLGFMGLSGTGCFECWAISHFSDGDVPSGAV